MIDEAIDASGVGPVGELDERVVGEIVGRDLPDVSLVGGEDTVGGHIGEDVGGESGEREEGDGGENKGPAFNLAGAGGGGVA